MKPVIRRGVKLSTLDMALKAGACYENKDAVVAMTPERSRQKCRICGYKGTMEYDHTFPQSRGGVGMRLICRECNRIKTDQTIRDAELRRRIRYRRAKYRDRLLQEGWT